MKRFMTRRRTMITLIVLTTFSARTVTPAYAEPVIELKKWTGTIDFSEEGPSSFALAGTSSHLGLFSAYGEVELVPGEEEGSLDGEGVVVFKAANGDLLVGVTTWEVDGDQIGELHFSWRDSVQFSDGTTVASTGRFAEADGRPRGLVVIAIIAVLIGLLVPAVQKVREAAN